MLKNYLKIAWRNLKKQPFFTFLNTFGLAIGMAGGLLISLYIYDELNHDSMFPDVNRLYRVNADVNFGGDAREFAEVSAPMAEAMQNDIPQIELTTRFRNRYSMLIRKNEADLNVKESNATFVDATFFSMFGFDLLYGDTETALKEPNTLILTRTAAEKHFGIDEAVGKSLILNNTDTYTVTGVIENMPKNSFLGEHHVFMAMSGWEDSKVGNWGSHDYPTFIKLLPTAKIEDIQPSLKAMFGKYVIPYAQETFPGITEEQFLAAGNYLRYSTIPLTDIHLYSNRAVEFSSTGDIQNVYILSSLALFLIILASVNFMNLSTAYSLKRAKEVGIRKTLGSGRTDLISQFLSESALITFMSLLLAVTIATIALPFFNELSGKTIVIPLGNPLFWLTLLLSTLLLGLFSGIYPAFFMSRFVPSKVLKGGGEKSVGGGSVRSSLVVFQFAISVFLIVGTLVIFQQLNFMQNKDLGYTKDKILVVDDVYAAGNKVQAFKHEVQRLGQVDNATLTGYLPTPSFRRDNSFFREGATEQENAIQMQNWTVDFDYINTLNLEVIAGRNFDSSISTDSLSMIVNESAIRNMNMSPEEVLGLRIMRPSDSEIPVYVTVIGVVKNFHFESLRNGIRSLSLQIGESTGLLAVKLNTENLSAAMASIENTWNELAPGQPFNYYFIDESFNNTYQAEQRLGKIFIVFTLLSILIACLGLFGLAAFNAEKRTKEIGIRKVLGASVGQISYRLSIDFLKLVGFAILISLPLGWYFMNKWLEDFSYRMEMNPWVFAIAGFAAVGIALLTISFQAIRAATANPIKSLRTE